MAEPHFGEVGQLGHRSHGGTRSLDRVGLLDGDGGTDVLHRIDLGFVEQIEKLPGVGGKGLHVPSLPLGMQGVEYQR